MRNNEPLCYSWRITDNIDLRLHKNLNLIDNAMKKLSAIPFYDRGDATGIVVEPGMFDLSKRWRLGKCEISFLKVHIVGW